MSQFRVLPAAAQTAVPTPTEYPDNRTLVQRMFFDHNTATGELIPLPIYQVADDDDYKRYNDCILLVPNFRSSDDTYSGEMKGKSVIVFGGRRKGRAGTGVELVIAPDDVREMAKLMNEVVKTVQAPPQATVAA